MAKKKKEQSQITFINYNKICHVRRDLIWHEAKRDGEEQKGKNCPIVLVTKCSMRRRGSVRLTSESETTEERHGLAGKQVVR